MSDIYTEFDAKIQEDAWEYLRDNEAALAETVRKAVERGATPEGLRSRWLKQAGEHRIALAVRIENAAKYLESLKVKA